MQTVAGYCRENSHCKLYIIRKLVPSINRSRSNKISYLPCLSDGPFWFPAFAKQAVNLAGANEVRSSHLIAQALSSESPQSVWLEVSHVESLSCLPACFSNSLLYSVRCCEFSL
uniref:Uncharacterized protein n=1 Tax=Gopherus agassizii TaxID=38772 RepID=A0A452H5J3_9SAUR